MTELCTCDHLKGEHLLGFGRCQGRCVDWELGDKYPCVCRKFEER